MTSLSDQGQHLPEFGGNDWYFEQWNAHYKTLHKAIEETRQLIQEDMQNLEAALKQWTDSSSADIVQFVEGVINYYEELPAPGDSNFEEKWEEFSKQLYFWRGPILDAPYIMQKTKVCNDLLSDLSVFAKTVFEFFCIGWFGDRNNDESQFVKEIPSNQADLAAVLGAQLDRTAKALYFAPKIYSPNYGLRTLMDQISIDLNIIQQAFNQRNLRACLKAENEQKADSQRQTLRVADALAEIALKPAIDGGFLDARYSTVLSYLNRSVEIRLLPYHDAVLIGIPFSASANIAPIYKTEEDADGSVTWLADFGINPTTSYLTIPHEIGHQIYQYGQLTWKNGKLSIKKRLHQLLLDKPYTLRTNDWRFRWLEELFADAYGCLVAGPISVLGFQEYLADGLPRYDPEHTSKHPINVLRPLIQTQILRRIADQYGSSVHPNAPDLLDNHWQQWVKDHWSHWVEEQWPYGYGDQTDIVKDAVYEIDGQNMSGQAILDDLQGVIDAILRVLNKLHPEGEAWAWAPRWNPGQYPEQAKLTELYREFCKFTFREIVKADMPAYHRLYQLMEQTLKSVAQKKGEQSTGDGESPTDKYQWLLVHLEELKREYSYRTGIDGLIELLLFEGWSTEGPGAGGIH